MYDLIIIGGGPAGLTAGIYASRSNLKTLIIEKDSIGGQIASSPRVENYPGFKSISGSELADNLFEQATEFGCEFEIDEIKEIKDGKIKKVIGDNTYETKSIIIATGANYRHLNLPGEDKLIGKKIHFCTSCDGAFYKGKTVAVVGGANSAITNALYLADICKKVYLIVRKDHLKGEQKLIKEINDNEKIEVLYNTKIVSVDGDILINKDEKESKLDVDGIFLAIGMDANNEVVKNIVNLSDEGYALDMDSKCDGIFVAGDILKKDVRQLTTAVSDGTKAAIKVINYLKGN